MKKTACIMVAVIVGMSLMAALVPAESAPLPVWKVGDRWAMGSENTNSTDLGNAGNMSGILSNLYGITNLSGKISSNGGEWMTFEVTGENETEYTLHYSLALRDRSDISASFTAMAPVAGEYTESTFENAPKAPVSMKIDFSSSFYTVASGDVHLMKDSMEISDISIDLNEKMSALFASSNTPYVGDYGIFGYFMLESNDSSAGMPSSFELSYRNSNIDLSQNLRLNAKLEFSPPLEFIKFPLSTGSEWSSASYEGLNGTYSGIINIKGLPPMVESALKLGTGQDLPIQIEKIDTHTDGFNNGIIEHHGYENTTMNCPKTISVAGPHGEQISAYEIGFGQQSSYGPQIYLLYSPDTSFIAGIYEEGLGNQMPISPVAGEAGIAGQFGSLASSMKMMPDTFSIGYMDYDHASKEISATENDMNGTPASQNFMLLALLITAGIAVVVAAVLVRRKRTAETAPYPLEESENTATQEIPEDNNKDEEQVF